MKQRLRGTFAAAALGLAAACTPITQPLADGNKSRRMTDGEISLAHQIFGDRINYERVRIHKKAKISLARSRVHNNSIYMSIAAYRDDYSQSRNSTVRGKFIHEMAHVWQHQSGKNLIGEAVGLFFEHGGDYDKAYDYTILDLEKFERLGIEQQAKIIQDYFYLNETARPWNAARTCRDMERLADAIKGTFPTIPISRVCRTP